MVNFLVKNTVTIGINTSHMVDPFVSIKYDNYDQ